MYFEDFVVGQKFQTEPVAAAEEDMRAFAAKYDPLSIHTDPEFAGKSIYGGIIAPGLFTLCLIWGQWVRLHVVNEEVIGGLCIDFLNWLAPVRPGDTLTAAIEVTDCVLSSKGGRGILTVRVSACSQNGETVLETQVKGLIKCRE